MYIQDSYACTDCGWIQEHKELCRACGNVTISNSKEFIAFLLRSFEAELMKKDNKIRPSMVEHTGRAILNAIPDEMTAVEAMVIMLNLTGTFLSLVANSEVKTAHRKERVH